MQEQNELNGKPAEGEIALLRLAPREVGKAHRILRLPGVIAQTGLSRSTIYLRVSQGEFPKQVRLGFRAVGWLESDIQGWLEEQIVASRQAA
jgi:prophage regulatory protein